MASREPSPNRGASIPDFQAIGENQVNKVDWLKERGIDQTAQVKLVKLAHMRYQHPDLAQITAFLRGAIRPFSCITPRLTRNRFRATRGEENRDRAVVLWFWARPVRVLCSSRAEGILGRCV